MIEQTLDDIRDLIFKQMEIDLTLLITVKKSNEASSEDKKSIIKSHSRFFIIYGRILELFQNIDMPYSYNIPMQKHCRLKISYEIENALQYAIKNIKKQSQQDIISHKNLLLLESKLIELKAINL